MGPMQLQMTLQPLKALHIAPVCMGMSFLHFNNAIQLLMGRHLPCFGADECAVLHAGHVVLCGVVQHAARQQLFVPGLRSR